MHIKRFKLLIMDAMPVGSPFVVSLLLVCSPDLFLAINFSSWQEARMEECLCALVIDVLFRHSPLYSQFKIPFSPSQDGSQSAPCLGSGPVCCPDHAQPPSKLRWYWYEHWSTEKWKSWHKVIYSFYLEQDKYAVHCSTEYNRPPDFIFYISSNLKRPAWLSL